ncbi:UPF0481-like protein [Cinnamomum micranthum f. kanehirae]|uniref:UPF0481-like protein n=1 Tax=Cinnamomum micranthum f. kanehirae TaxID=337451 RepID=A0A443PHQ4_9MAGN|nr:UPF0481-like protein [Cinnamomum micranthum f. kanehirae]
MADSEKKPPLPPLSSSPATSSRGGDAIISIPKSETHVEFIRRRLAEQKPTNNDNREEAIRRVPFRLRQGKNNMYEPLFISIGPYHRGRPKLQEMEKIKFQNISGIIDSPDFEDLIGKLELKEKQVRGCYTNNFIPMSSKDFVEMMLLDSYFIIKLLTEDAVENLGDPSPLMLHDLLLLENQLPFFLIQFVFDTIGKSSSNLISLAHRFYRQATQKIIYHTHTPNPDEDVVRPCRTLLQLYHRFIISPQTNLSPEKPKSNWINFNCNPFFPTNGLRRLSKNSEEIMIPNATVLHEAGIKFRKNEGRGILDVKFNGGVLEIPPLFMDDGTVSLFHNLIALENTCGDVYYSNEEWHHFAHIWK